MARKYTYETTLNIHHLGERDIKVSFECPDFAYVEGIEVLAVEGNVSPFDALLVEEIELELTADLHNDRMLQKAYVEDSEAQIEAEERRQERAEERRWEEFRAGCRT